MCLSIFEHILSGRIKMGYCFFSTEKVKSQGELTSKYIHNYRQINVENADNSLLHLNEELLELGYDKNGVPKTYNDFFKERIDSLPYYKNHKIRKNAVHAIEVITTFSKGEDIDIQSWKKKNVEWMQNTFNVAKDKKSNIASIVYHADEPGNVHCHAIIVPIDENGHLNASRFLDGSKKLSDLQTSYAKDMEEFGLERGLEGSQARHQDIKKYYAGLNRGIEVDPPKENESALEYHNRILDQIQELQADSMRRRDEADREARRKIDEERIQQRKILERELLTAKSSISTDIDKLYKEKNDTEKEIALLHSQKAQIEKTVHDLQMQVDDFYKQQAFVQENIGKIEKYEYIEAQYRRLLQSDPEQAEMINSLLLAGNSEKEQENTII